MTHPEQSEKRGRHESLTLSSLREGEGTPRASQDSNRVSSADSFNVTTPPVSFTVSDIISGGSATITPPLNELLIDKYVNQSASPSVRSINQSVCRSTIPSIIIDRSITRTTKTITNKTNLYTIKEATTQLAAKSRITRYLKCYALNEEERSRDPSIPSLSCSLRLSFFFFFSGHEHFTNSTQAYLRSTINFTEARCVYHAGIFHLAVQKHSSPWLPASTVKLTVPL